MVNGFYFGEFNTMYTVHDVPGRLRIRIEKLKNNPYRLDQIRELLMVEGVYRVKTNAVTGSVIIEYDKYTLRSPELVAILSENGYPADERRKQEKRIETHEKIAVTLSRATFSWLAGRVLEANGLAYIAAFI